MGELKSVHTDLKSIWNGNQFRRLLGYSTILEQWRAKAIWNSGMVTHYLVAFSCIIIQLLFIDLLRKTLLQLTTDQFYFCGILYKILNTITFIIINLAIYSAMKHPIRLKEEIIKSNQKLLNIFNLIKTSARV